MKGKIEKKLNNKNVFIIKGESIDMGRKGQMMLISAIIISVTLLSMSLMATHLSNIGATSFKMKELSLFREYYSVRAAFLTAVYVNLHHMENPSYSDIEEIVNATRDSISLIETRYGNQFDAKLTDAQFSFSPPHFVYLTIRMELLSGSESVSEEATHVFRIGTEVL